MPNTSLVGTRHYTGTLSWPIQPFTNSENIPVTRYFVLPHLGAIQVQGEKAADFLQGQLSCDIRAITPHYMQQGALCNIKGRVRALCDVLYHDATQYWLILPHDIIAHTLKSLEKPAMLARVRLTPTTQAQLIGILAPATFPPQHTVFPQEPYTVTAWGPSTQTPTGLCYALSNTQKYIFLTESPASVSSLFSTLQTQNTPQLFVQEHAIVWHMIQLQQHRIQIYPETQGAFLPHALGLHTKGYIHFHKGCYKGQEIIARMHYRASHLKQTLQCTTLWLPQPPLLGQTLLHPDTSAVLGTVVDYCPYTLSNTSAGPSQGMPFMVLVVGL